MGLGAVVGAFPGLRQGEGFSWKKGPFRGGGAANGKMPRIYSFALLSVQGPGQRGVPAHEQAGLPRMELWKGEMEPASLFQRPNGACREIKARRIPLVDKPLGLKNTEVGTEPALYQGIGGGKPCFRL